MRSIGARLVRAGVAVLTACAALGAEASGLDALEAFLKNVAGARAEFRQTVTSPAKEGATPRVRHSSGVFSFSRPLRFRFDYTKPFEQAIVADGQTLWLHDVDLNQVTARKQADLLSSTPAALLAAHPDLAALRRDFVLESAPPQDGVDLVQATPRQKDGQISRVRVGFKAGQLSQLDILDSFGQRSVLQFGKLELNPVFSAQQFQFKPPAGADVVRQ